MGNREWGKGGAVFRQSLYDFPLTVSLGEKMPSWGLTRWGGKGGLRFIPPDDEGFTLRGDRRRLVYRGRRRSHRFTVLGDSSFEYDCILLREPESNIIVLRMEGAGNFDFFRQPEFVNEPLLKGSYAVYKKETLIGEGTGKLCHIHRPEIIDAGGQRCWGELSVIGNELRIIIPEWFLSEAKYPVIVDPTIGTTTVGSQNKWVQDVGEPPISLMFELSIPVNRFLVSETINGLCTAYAYVNEDDYDAGGRPVLYTDNGNKPQTRKSANEGFIDLRVTSGKPKGWRTASFSSNGSISSGSYIWFGVFCEDYWFPRFDYGSRCYSDYNSNYGVIPNTYPLYNVNWYEDFRLSMYFTYTSAQNYVRTLTQGVNLTDGRKIKAEYKRKATQKVKVNSALNRFETLFCKCVMTVHNTMQINRLPLFFRNVTEQVKVTMSKNEIMSFSRLFTDGVKVISEIKKLQIFLRIIHESLKTFDTKSFSVLILRSVNDTTTVTDNFHQIGSFVRGLFLTAGNTTEMKHKADYTRKQKDLVQADGSVFRGLLLFIRIVSKVFIRDYILGRFLKAREELTLKSAVCREIILESKID